MTDRIPVTVLVGSLGAGKTTTLNHLLTTEHDHEIAVIVNDMGEVNIDVDHVERHTELPQTGETVVEMSNGCICCRLRGDLVAAVEALAENRDFDYLLIEASGISEPIPLAQTFIVGTDETGYDPSEEYVLDTMVSVVDAAALYHSFAAGEALTHEPIQEADDRVPEAVLLEQIESCDVLLLNKGDLVPSDSLDEIESIIERLQPDAAIVRTEFGRIDPAQILATNRFELETAKQAGGWRHELSRGGDHEHHHGHDPAHEAGATTHGVQSFVFRANKPVHPERFLDVLCELPPEVIRAKGFFWSAGREETALSIDKAGRSVRAGPSRAWITTLSEEHQEHYLNAYDEVAENWDPNWGDRRVELVFIGKSLDHEALTTALEASLLTPDEMDSDWSTFRDPFGEAQREYGVQALD